MTAKTAGVIDSLDAGAKKIVAQTLDKAEPACRQLISRARAQLRESRARFRISNESRDRLLKKFLVAIGSGSRQAVMALLAEDVEYMAEPLAA